MVLVFKPKGTLNDQMREVSVMIRAERSDDIAAVHAVNVEAFGREAEAALADRLREELRIFKSLVAVKDGNVVGNVVFSNLSLKTRSGDRNALALAPVAVLPEVQGRKIGTRLITGGLELCRGSEAIAVLVLGDPKYYTRFGFSGELAQRIKSPYSGAGAAWMALEPREGALENQSGVVTYPDAFKLVD
jgi:putative acetyltransferase